MHRGSHEHPANRFESIHQEPDWEHLAWDQEYRRAAEDGRVEFLPDASQSVVSTNDSPDIPFRYSLNPYRGCQHGCAYCYARPTHEFLGFSAGLDFETKIIVKHDAPERFRQWLSRRTEAAEVIVLSGVTDPYQPCERRFQITRACLEVALEARQPTAIVTKNALVLRDIDLIRLMARQRLLHVLISLTTLDRKLARALEPATSTPEARLRTIAELRKAGVPVGVMTAPILPGLTDRELPDLLREAAAAGAQTAGYQLLRLPLSVEPIFLKWLDRNYPEARSRVEKRLRAARGGRLNDHRFGHRMRGQGTLADSIRNLFQLFAREYELDQPLPKLDVGQFRPPSTNGQQWLF